MMTISNSDVYSRFMQMQHQSRNSFFYVLVLPMLLFGSMGAITWAIRGTAGWGGVDGTVIPGLMWGILWYFFARQRGIDAGGVIFWLGFGIALGGELGYGQYTAWILGKFYVGNEIIHISPVIGYVWFVLCGIGWAAAGGVFLGWALGRNASISQWIVRSLLVVVLLLFLFAWPLVDWLAAQMARLWPGLLFPNADLGIYDGELGKHLSRTVYTNTQNFAVVLWWIVALIIAALQRDRTTLVTGLLIGGGFGLGFLQSALWCLGYGVNPSYIDWWKMWELNAGFNLGILYALALYWATNRLEKKSALVDVVNTPNNAAIGFIRKARLDTLYLAAAGAVLLFFTGFEYFFWTGNALTLIFIIGMILVASISVDSWQRLIERRKNFLLVYSLFYYVFLLFHGGSTRGGILLEVYSADAIDQYAWPLGRILIFAPFAIIIVSVAFMWMSKILFQSTQPRIENLLTSERLIDVMTITAFIGALSIWPQKIGVIYAFFIFLALYSFTRLNFWHNQINHTFNQEK